MINKIPKPINVMLHPWIGRLRDVDPSIIKPARNKQGKMIDYAKIHRSFCGYYDDGWMTDKQVNSWHTICKVAQKNQQIVQDKKAVSKRDLV
ncbi:hypothetical protein OAL97_04760 [Paracoccaceae bacterium]|nr:hypothetical protein [Paracoccaceae bacterium]